MPAVTHYYGLLTVAQWFQMVRKGICSAGASSMINYSNMCLLIVKHSAICCDVIPVEGGVRKEFSFIHFHSQPNETIASEARREVHCAHVRVG